MPFRTVASLLTFACLMSPNLFRPAYAQTADELPLMPVPASVQRVAGEFIVDGTFASSSTGYTEPRLARAEQRFMDRLSGITGILFVPVPPGSKARFIVHVEKASQPVQQLGEDEAYRLTIGPEEVHLDAANPLGVLRGLQTICSWCAWATRVLPCLPSTSRTSLAFRGAGS
jgi:hexosaminidase